MYRCIAYKENLFLVLDTKDGVCEWTTIQDCKKYIRKGVDINGLTIKNLNSSHEYVEYNPVIDFIPDSIADEVHNNCMSTMQFNHVSNIIEKYILRGNNIIALRRTSGSYKNFLENLARWWKNGLQ